MGRVRLLVAGLAGLIIVVGLTALPAVAAGHTLSGTVRDGDGNPLSGAQVRVQVAGGGGYVSTTADAAGHYALTGLDGSYFVDLIKATFPEQADVMVVAGPEAGVPHYDLSAADVVRDLTLPTAHLTVQVFDPDNGAMPNLPMSINERQATFTLTPGDSPGYRAGGPIFGATDPSGQAELLAFELTIQAGRVCTSGVVATRICNTTPVTVAGDTSIALHSHRLTGTVRDGNGSPAAGASLEFTSPHTHQIYVQTDANGHYSVVLGTEDHYLTSASGGGLGGLAVVNVAAVPHYDLATADRVADFDVPTAPVTVRLLDGNGVPMPGVQVVRVPNSSATFALTPDGGLGYASDTSAIGAGWSYGTTDAAGDAVVLAYDTTWPAGTFCGVGFNGFCNTQPVTVNGPTTVQVNRPPLPAGGFAPLTPARILDTRFGNGAPIAAVPANGDLVLQVAGRGGVPADAGAVVLNVTVVGPGAAGYVTAFPTGTTVPTASNLNFTSGQVISNLVTVRLGTDGKVTLHNGSPAALHLVADVSGYYTSGIPTKPGTFASLVPTRLLDTRTGNGAPVGKVAAQSTLELQVAGQGGVPADAGAVVLNVTVTEPTASGFVTAYPTGAAAPLASNLNFTPGQTVPNLVTVKVGTGGKVSLLNGSPGGVHLLVDVAGYYLAGEGTERGTFVSMVPYRRLDTRQSGKLAPLGTADVFTGGGNGVGASAVVMNVTVTEPTAAGFITVYPKGAALPTASNLNFTAGKTIPNMAIVGLGPDTYVSLYNGSAGQSNLIVDVCGYFLS